MTIWGSLLWLFSFLAVHGLGCYGAKLLVRAEQRRRDRKERERRAGGVTQEVSVRHPGFAVPPDGDPGRAEVERAGAPAPPSARSALVGEA